MRCPVCSAEIVDLYPKPRCRTCGYVESCCQPELPCPVPDSVRTDERMTSTVDEKLQL